mgnify:CR=1 FL=1
MCSEENSLAHLYYKERCERFAYIVVVITTASDDKSVIFPIPAGTKYVSAGERAYSFPPATNPAFPFTHIICIKLSSPAKSSLSPDESSCFFTVKYLHFAITDGSSSCSLFTFSGSVLSMTESASFTWRGRRFPLSSLLL